MIRSGGESKITLLGRRMFILSAAKTIVVFGIVGRLISLQINENKKYLFGQVYGSRSGDKCGCANIGVWAKTDLSYSFLYDFLTVKRLKKLMPDLRKFEIDRYELSNIKSLNFYIHGILEDGVSSNNRVDGQAKSLGEYLRAKIIDMPKLIINENSNG